jgi:hypothetical protein
MSITDMERGYCIWSLVQTCCLFSLPTTAWFSLSWTVHAAQIANSSETVPLHSLTNTRPAAADICHLVQNLNVHSRVHNSSTMYSISSHLNAVHTIYIILKIQPTSPNSVLTALNLSRLTFCTHSSYLILSLYVLVFRVRNQFQTHTNLQVFIQRTQRQ